MAMGIFGISTLVGPVLGPVIGGIMANSFGWRSMFILLAILGAVVETLIIFLLPGKIMDFFLLMGRNYALFCL